MTDKKFMSECKSQYAKLYKVDIDEIFVVWSCKTIQNFKCWIGSRSSDILMECTYNGDKCELYLDSYIKVRKDTISI